MTNNRTVQAWMLGVVLAMGAHGASAQSDVCEQGVTGPLQVRNISPVAQLYGVPRMAGACTWRGATGVSFNFELVNNFQSDSVGDVYGFFDGETYLTSYEFTGALGERWDWSFEVPYLFHRGGKLDGVIDDFHTLFGLPDGNRDLTSNGRLDMLVAADGAVYADIDGPTDGVGDVRAGLGYQIRKDENSALAIRTRIKFATGDADKLTGSGATDVAVWAEYERRVALAGRDWYLSLGGGGTYLGEGDLIPDAQENVVLNGHIGLRVPLRPGIDFIAQADGHTRYLDTPNPLLADGGFIGTLGARFTVNRQFWVDVAIIEDLKDESAADVAFQILLSARL